MSWVVDEWKDGLPTKTLQKIQELESQLDKLKKERQQRQFQLESLEAAFQKQKQKVESEKSEVTALKRENQSLIELCDNQEKTRQKMAHDQQMKDTQINILDGQLSASKKQIEKLEQELKRFKNDMERGQQSFNGMDMSVCVTPQKSFAASFTPVKINESKYEELQDKYNKEVEERKKLETEIKILQIKLLSQNSQTPQPSSQNTINHRDIARHQASSSVFSWQQERTPSRSSSSSHDTSLKRSFTSTQCPWEQEETPSKRGYKPDNSNRSFCEPFNTAANDQLKSQNQELRSKVSELELRLQVQEKELKNQLNKLQETQTLLEKTQTELQEKDKVLTKSRDDLSRVTLQYDQTADKCAQTEQKLKKVTEELSCQRQNAESARLTVENKLKEREKENQQELLRQQNSLKTLEQQLNQMKAKLSQESQQAKNEFNAIQSELDRAVHGKKVLEGEVEELKQKLSKAEHALQASENQANQFKKNLEEAKAQHNAIRSQLDQKTREALKMEEEVNVANQTIRKNQQLVDKLTDKIGNMEAELKCAMQKLQGQDSASLQNLKESVSTLQKERDLAHKTLKKKEVEMEEAKKALVKMSEESLALKNELDCKEKECKELINTNISLSRWKDEHENTSRVSSEREEMLARVKELECLLQSHKDQLNALENDKNNLHIQVKNLQEQLDVKTTDLETQQATCSKIQQQLESEGQKYQNDIDCLVKRIYELEAEVKLRELDNSSSQVSYLENELQNQKKMHAELQSHHDELLKSKTDIQNEMVQMKEMHERFVSESQCQVESLQSNISSKQTYAESLVSAIREKEEEMCILSEKLRHTNSGLQSANQNNKELHDKLQELKQLSESWSTERELLTSLISSNKKEIEMRTADNKQMQELKNKVLPSVDLGPAYDQADKQDCTDNMEEECVTESNPSMKECQSLRKELEEFKEKLDRIQKENNRLLRANEELTALVGNLRNNELSLNKLVEELSVSLKEKEKSSKKLQSLLDSLKKDCESEFISVEDIDQSVGCLQKSSSQDAESHIDPNHKQEVVPNSNALREKSNNLMEGDQTILLDEFNPLFTADDSKILGDVNEETLPLSSEPQHHEENQTLLINLDQLSLTSADDVTKSLSQLMQSNQSQDQRTASLSPFTSPTAKSDETGEKVTKDRKSVSGQLVDLILQQAPEDQSVLFSRLTNEDPCSAKDLLTVYQVELCNMRKQYLSDIADWQQKLKEQASNMEAKLLEEKARSDQLSQELEAAKLELQVLDLSARSLLFDNEDITTRFDVANQSLCTILPIGRLSLDIESRKCDTPKQGQGSSPNNSEESPEEASKEEDNENNECRRSLRQRKKRKTNTADKQTPNVNAISENSNLKAMESVKEKEQLLQLVKEKEMNNQHLLMEVKELTLQIEINKTELGIKEGQNQELEQKAKKLESERTELLEKIDLISCEKLQSSNRIVELDKALHETLSKAELLKAEITELSEIKETLELSSEKWKESCLQAENELRRSKSENENIEKHALSLEADLDSLQSKCQHLQEESEKYLRALNSLEDVLKGVQAEKNLLTQELESLVEEKEVLEQMNKKLKEREVELESNRDNSKELIKILEADIRTLKHEIEIAKTTAGQLTEERNNLVLLRENENVQVQELQNLVQQIQDEKKLWSHERQELETQLSTSVSKMEELTRSLDRCQVEKREMATRLNSTQEEVALMRTGIEKLKVKIESDEKKKRQTMEKLKDSERKFDNLNDKIESLERELTMAEENLENAILQTESAKEEAECLKSQKEALEEELIMLRARLVDLENELQNNRNKVIELETAILALTETLKKGEAEHTQFRETSQRELEMLQTQMNNMCEQKAHTDQRYVDLTARMEQERAQLETAKEEAKSLVSQKEAMEEELTMLRRQFANVENGLQDSQAKVVELESTVLALTETLEQGKAEHTLFKENSEKDLEKLQTQMNDLCEQKALTDERYKAISVESSEIIARMEHEKAQLETAKEEAKCLKSQKEAMEEELTMLRSKLLDVENGLKDSQVKVIELETTVLTLTETLERGKAEHTLFKENSEKELEKLQTQINDMCKQKALTDERYKATLVESSESIARMEHEKAQLETAKEEAKCLKSQKEAMEEELTMLRSKLLDVENGLQDNQAKVIELETTILTLTGALEQGEADHTLFKESSKKDLALLQAQMNDLREQKTLSDQRCEAVKAECAEIASKMEQEKAQLVQQLEEAQIASCDLKQSIEKLSLELEECKLQLSEKTQQLMELQTQLRGSGEVESKYSSEHSRLELETENLRNEKMNLLSRLEELENKLQTTSAENSSVQAVISDLRTSCNNLETQLESANSEKRIFHEKVAELTENCSKLQSKLNDADLHIKTAEDQSGQDRRALEEAMQTIKQLQEENDTRLQSAKSKITELNETIISLQNEMESQAVTQKSVIMEYEQRLLQAESLHKSILDETVKQHKEDLDRYQEKLTSLEGLLAAHVQEIDGLKASSNESSFKAQEQLVGLQAHIDRMTEDSSAASEALNRWANACKQLEEEKEELKKHIAEQEEALETLKMNAGRSRHGLNRTEDGMDSNANDTFSEIEELKQCLEEKTQEADESIEKYCNLMIKTHKLEENNDLLKKQLDFLNSRLREFDVKKEQSCPPSIPNKPSTKDCPPSIPNKPSTKDCPPSIPSKPSTKDCPPSISDKPLPEPEKRTRKSRRSSQGPSKQSNKRQRDSDNTGSAPSTPQCVTKKVKRTYGTLVEDEFEPDGLPDVVRKGFADIPSGKQSPYVLRRTTTPLRQSPRLASQKNSPSLFSTHNNLENLPDLSSPTAEGSKSQEAKNKETIVMANSRPVDNQSPLAAHNKMKRRLSEMGTPGKMDTAAVHDDSEEEGGNCQVQ